MILVGAEVQDKMFLNNDVYLLKSIYVHQNTGDLNDRLSNNGHHN